MCEWRRNISKWKKKCIEAKEDLSVKERRNVLERKYNCVQTKKEMYASEIFVHEWKKNCVQMKKKIYGERKKSGVFPLRLSKHLFLSDIHTSLRQRVFQFIYNMKVIYKIIQYFLTKELEVLCT